MRLTTRGKKATPIVAEISGRTRGWCTTLAAHSASVVGIAAR
jgi:hypothetical protein